MHFVLDDIAERNALLKSDPMMKFLSKALKFMPTPVTISAPTIRQDISCLRGLLMKPIKDTFTEVLLIQTENLGEAIGIKAWIPKQFFNERGTCGF